MKCLVLDLKCVKTRINRIINNPKQPLLSKAGHKKALRISIIASLAGAFFHKILSLILYELRSENTFLRMNSNEEHAFFKSADIKFV